MDLENQIIADKQLNVHAFSRIFANKAQSYKFYWFEAILNLLPEKDEFSFDEIINEMIFEAWYTVSHYHLRLGPTVNGNAENFLEHAIRILADRIKFSSSHPSREEILTAIKTNDSIIRADKTRLTDYVPYKLLFPFFDNEKYVEGLTYIKEDKHSRLINYMAKITDETALLYTIIDGVGLNKTVRVNKYWKEFILNNYSIIKSWVQYNKAQFLQDRNPGVPGIIYKISPDCDENRKLEQVRDLWRKIVVVTGQPLFDIYTKSEISLDSLSIDHFIPRSYISNDEIWNLIPMDRRLNSSKNNKLPLWDVFFEPFAKYQVHLYKLLFSEKTDALCKIFEKCRRHNLNALWATEKLYISGNTDIQFINVLEHNMKPIYEAAQLQGYEIWNCTEVNNA